MVTMYGILDNGTHTDVSKTLRGAKNYATRNGFKIVTVRHGYNAKVISVKLSGGNWADDGSKTHKEWLKLQENN